MTHKMALLLFAATFVVASVTVFGQGPNNLRPGILAEFKEGQLVILKDVAGRYEISIVDGVPANDKIIGVGSDYLTIEDLGGNTETKIPIYSIKSCVRIKNSK